MVNPSSDVRRFVGLGLAASILVLTGCTGAPASAPAAQTSHAPSPTPTAESATVPFGGDCTTMLEGAEPSDAMGVPVTLSAPELVSMTPDMPSSLTLIGSIACVWQGTAGEHLQVSVFPMSQTSPDIVAQSAGTGCDEGTPVCWASQTVGNAWIYAESAQSTTGAEKANALVADRMAHEPEPKPAPPSADRWTMPTCEILAPTVATATGVKGLEEGFPGDGLPFNSPTWATADAVGSMRWCSWYVYSGSDVTIVQLNLQPGAAAPTSALLADAKAKSRAVAGADTAYDLAREGDTARVLAVSGENRLTVAVTGEPEKRIGDITAAVLAQLNGH